MVARRYANGNCTIRKEHGETLCAEEQNLFIAIAWEIPDMELLGEQGCAGNFDMYQMFYNRYTDRKYTVLASEQAVFDAGRTVRLIAQPLDEEDRWLLEEQAG